MSKTKKSAHVSRVLPLDARNALVEASQTHNPRTDPLRRQKAIEEATRRAKFLYPHLFKHPEI